jgi:Raf kinase inhibitor-like YbhB/YbcL family protein
MSFALTSTAFAAGDVIPKRFTCEGDNIAPPLAWSGAPDQTRSFALVMDDPDAPHGTFTHWLVYDIPATAHAIGSPPVGRTLSNDFGRAGYSGPCPPRGHGPHRYVFTLHALDVAVLALRGRERSSLDEALAGHTLAVATFTATYERKR